MKLNHSNPIRTKKDYQQLMKVLVDPLKKYYTKDNTLLDLGCSGTVYDQKTRCIEAFARPLWGLVPFWVGGGVDEIESVYIEGLRNGTNQAHPNYWGEYENYHQVYVEMAAIALGILATPEKLWNPLSEEEKESLANWLLQINDKEIVTNNWQFFRVLINIALKKVGARYSQEAIDYSLGIVEDCYLGDGWYSDGKTPQKDYYIAFAIHFYSMIYVRHMKEDDEKRCGVFVERAKLFAEDFIYWFTENGDALPFGRSQAYRFAQCAFFGGLVYADVEALEWGVVKGVINRHMRWWMEQPIFDKEGILTIGYSYPNLHMSEGYNGEGSPYWAFKGFLMMAVDEVHPFWQVDELPLPKLDKLKYLPHPQMLIQRPEEGHVVALTSGQYADFEPVHVAEKYAKFAYSSYFGFSVPRSYFKMDQAATDSMLAFKKDNLYFIRRRCIEVKISEKEIYSKWSPLEGVVVETTLIPSGKGHTRRHIIHAAYDIEAVECGFTVPNDCYPLDEHSQGEGYATIDTAKGYSHIEVRKGKGNGKYILCEPNTNMIHPRTVMPFIELSIKKGTTEIEVYVEGLKEKNKI